MKQAIGMIETYGMIGLIEAADVMLKSSSVHLLGSTQVGGGINTVMIEGDVGAVEAAVQSAKASVSLLGKQVLLSAHVIPRPEIMPEAFVSCKKTKADEEQQTQAVKLDSLEKPAVDPATEQPKRLAEKDETAEGNGVQQSQQQAKAPAESLTVPEKILKVVQEELKQEKMVPKLSQPQVSPSESRELLQAKFQKMKVADLRKLAKEQKELSRPKKEIYQMSKAKLIQVLIDSLIINE
jgi:microcompartment protein CcmL/EutN